MLFFSNAEYITPPPQLKYITYKMASVNTGRFIMFSVITNIYNKKAKGPALMELFTATRKLKKFFFDN